MPVGVPNRPEAPPPRVQIRPGQPGLGGGARRPGPQSLLDDREPPSRGRRVLAAVVGALLVAGIVVALLAITSGSGNSSKHPGSAARNSNALASRRHRTVGPAVNPADVTVTVLNGTATTGLAHRVGARLGAAGYKLGNSTNAPDQTHTATIVAYLPGFRRDAAAVAKVLKLPNSAVAVVDPDTKQVACPASPAPCPANVVVTVGADLASTP